MAQPGRKYSAGSKYRYGFNGKENDSEVKGEGNQQDYGMRIYDPRLGRFLSIDPLTSKYSELTPYQFASNSPISLIDIDGCEGKKPPEPSGNDKSVISNVIKSKASGPFGSVLNGGLGNEGYMIDAATKSSGTNFGYSAWWRLSHGIENTYRQALGVTGEGIAADGEWKFFKALNLEQTKGRFPIASISMHSKGNNGTYDFKIGYAPRENLPLLSTFNNSDGSLYEVNFAPKKGSTFDIFYEVKTLGSKTTNGAAVMNNLKIGVNQTVENIQLNQGATRTIGVLIVDKAAYQNAINSGYGTELKTLIGRLNKAGGYLKLVENLTSTAQNFTNSIMNDVKQSTTPPTPEQRKPN